MNALWIHAAGLTDEARIHPHKKPSCTTALDRRTLPPAVLRRKALPVLPPPVRHPATEHIPFSYQEF
ncbi:hypothetical protein A0R06_25180 [Salmonella enterica]|nr:hypothetical protein [Salmonella enterica]EBT1279309.1 hypothetical protein [Salmonella enterica]